MTTVYKPKFGWGFMVPIVVVFGGSLFMMVYASEWIGFGFIALIGIYLLFAFLTTKYKLDGERLTVTGAGGFSLKIPIGKIRKIEETRSPLAAPAYAFDRLEILYNKYDSILIAPKNKQDFIVHLKTLNPEIEVKLKEKNPNNNS